MINAKDIGFVPNDPNFDNTIKLNDFLTGTEDTLYFPSGVYYFNTRPNTIGRPIEIFGAGINNVSLVKNYDESDLNKALLTATQTLNLHNVAIQAYKPGGGAIRLEGLGASASILRDLYITGSTSWQIPLTCISSDPLGIRSLLIDNVELFAATMQIAWLVNLRGATINLNAYPAGGVTNHIVIQGTGGYRSSNILFTSRYLETMWVYDTDNLTYTGLGSTVVNQSNSSNIRIL